jgi:hypothetical protein
MYEIQPTAELLVVGHTDATGLDWRNRSLSLERAEAVVAYLQDDVDQWYRHYTRQTDYSRRWGKDEDLAMLSALPRSEQPFYGEHHADHSLVAAIRRFQTARGLVVDGDAGENTRKALIREYMALDGTTLPEDTLVEAHGCGQAFPAIEADNVEPENRRVEIFLFRDGIVPRPSASTSSTEDGLYPQWVEQVEQERTFRPSAAGLGSLLLVTDIEGKFASAAAVEFVLASTDGAYEQTLRPEEDGTEVRGYVELTFTEMPRGSFYTLLMRDHAGAEQVLFEDVPFPELGLVGEDASEALVDPIFDEALE